jgi:diacylglycerol kinase family enzyme
LTIDVGWAGERMFLNNVSLGLYDRLVQVREHHRRQDAALARLRALAITVTNPAPTKLTIDSRPESARIFLVANNTYALGPMSLGARERLDEGELHLYLTSGLIGTAWTQRAADSFVIKAVDTPLDAAIDGEPVTLQSPTRFHISPKALRVLLPAKPAAAAPR